MAPFLTGSTLSEAILGSYRAAFFSLTDVLALLPAVPASAGDPKVRHRREHHELAPRAAARSVPDSTLCQEQAALPLTVPKVLGVKMHLADGFKCSKEFSHQTLSGRHASRMHADASFHTLSIRAGPNLQLDCWYDCGNQSINRSITAELRGLVNRPSGRLVRGVLHEQVNVPECTFLLQAHVPHRMIAPRAVFFRLELSYRRFVSDGGSSLASVLF
ncbi:hypothetical protein BAUCODRAFT_493470 [Baudoinia panamericana UAMH 10762]|uniref:Uncharacterized protein n=1 Tax=Baudoinia panamericana (strain UAMH 10762) TaxID=717646 RepID=M2MFZ5_BAUPA|nr:uncharacterized protein BAUCODRAFT_493470 [Baudoinia panamericana UAMH 10762]EMC95541.1 hypothetical protein BAUCODRAFT_493470 [Baudoinia panamericana UAMH 10762]